MGRNWFVSPETVTLELADGQWIEVKERLTYGEEQRLAGGALRPKLTDGEIDISLDLETHSILRERQAGRGIQGCNCLARSRDRRRDRGCADSAHRGAGGKKKGDAWLKRAKFEGRVLQHMKGWSYDDLYNCPDDIVMAILRDIKEGAGGHN